MSPGLNKVCIKFKITTHDSIISVKGGSGLETCLSPPLIIEVPVPSQKGGRHVYVTEYRFRLCFFMNFLSDFGTVFECGIIVCHFIDS